MRGPRAAVPPARGARPAPLRRARRALAGAASAAALCGPPAHPAMAQTCSSNAERTGLECPVVNLENGNPDFAGSLDWAIAQTNLDGRADREHRIVFTESLFNLTISVDTALPVIALDATSSVELDGNDIAGLFVEHTPDPDLPTPFTLLHVASGEATVVELDISGGDFRIDAGARLGFRFAEEHTIADDILGPGRLFKQGAGRLLLTGSNAYGGGTEVLEGTLAGDADALRGRFEIAKDAGLEFEIARDASEPFDGATSGEGRLLKSGAGRLTLGGSTAHTGGTEVAEGTLTATPASLTGDVEIRSGATLELRQPSASASYAGRLTGTGSVVKSGPGELVLAGANSMRGGLTIEEGTLRGPASAIPGDVLIQSASSSLILEQTTDGVRSGDINGAGRLIKQGPGRLTLIGSSSYTGGTIVRAGTLAGDALSLRGSILLEANPAEPTSLEFAQSANLPFSGTISGAGAVVKSGIGLLVFGTPQTYSGDTEVRGGLLLLDAPLPNSANVIVRPGAALRSNQSIGGNLDLFGALSIGAAGERFDVGGSALLRDGSQLSVSVTDLDQSRSRLVVAGNVVFEAGPRGSTIAVEAAPGLYTPARTYTIVESTAGTLSGPGFGLTAPDYAFLDIGLPAAASGSRYDISVVFNGNAVEQFAITPNQQATGRAVQELLNAGTPDSQEVARSFSVLTVASVPPVLDMLAGESLAAFTTSRFAAAHQFHQAIARRFTATRFEQRPEPRASSRPLARLAAAAERSRRGLGLWVEPFGVFGENDGRGLASDVTSRAYGVSLGADYRFSAGGPLPGSEHLRLGLAGGWAGHSLQTAGDRMQGRGDGFQLAGYGAFRSERLHAGVSARWAHTSLESDRRIFFGEIARRAEGSSSGREAGVAIEAGLRLGDPSRLLFHPLAGFQYTHLDQDASVEIGAGSLSLAVPRLEAESMLTTLGGRFSRLFTLRGEFGLEPELRLGWTHESGDVDRPIAAAFHAVPGATPFVTGGASADRDQFWIGGGYEMRIADVPLLSTHYDAFIGRDSTRHVVSLGLHLRW